MLVYQIPKSFIEVENKDKILCVTHVLLIFNFIV